MNVTVQDLAPCKKLLRIEVDASEVDQAFEKVTGEVQRQAQLPGFRPGKAPRHLIVRTYSREIEGEVRERLLKENYRKGVDQLKIHPVTQADIEELQFGKGKPMQFTATVETAPEFEIPEYQGLEIKREAAIVTDEDVEKAIAALRNERAAYEDVGRAVQSGDFVVVNYTGTCDGKPITETAPTARGLTEKQAFWLEVKEGSFIPGFTEQLVGAQAGEKRTVTVTFPADFVAPQLSGKTGVYEVEVVQVKEKKLPELSDAFATELGAANAAALREGVHRDLQNELSYKLKRSTRDQIVRQLLSRVQCELPEAIVMGETKQVVYDIVRENTQRGVPKEAIDRQKDQIFSVANNSAKDRVKTSFILARIASKEGIKVSETEIMNRVQFLAEQYQIKPDRMLRQLRERNGLMEIHEQILHSKVLDFIELHAKVEEVLPANT